jgi:hypothetical protein
MRHKRVLVTRYGGPEVIDIIEEDVPARKAGEVRVKVLAAGSVSLMSSRAKAFIQKRHVFPTRRVGTLSEQPISLGRA